MKKNKTLKMEECKSCGEEKVYAKGLCTECYDYALADLQFSDFD